MSVGVVSVRRLSAALPLAVVMLGLAFATGSRVSGQTAVATVHLTSGWATFGEAVPQGLSHTGLQVGSLPTQTDVKNRWPDGSIRFAIVTVKAPADATYQVSAARASSGTLRPVVPAASVTLTLSGVPYTATLPASTGRDRWLSGPLVDEGRTVVAPISGADGRAHSFLRVNFDTRVYNDGQARVDISVENMLDQVGATTVTYDVTIVINGQVAFSRSAVQHYYLTRWRKVFGVGSTPLAAVTPDISPFNVSRALPSYLPLVTNRVHTPTGARYDILREGALPANMPAQAGQDAAPFPDWTARYLVHKHPMQRAFVLANGDLSGSWPVHVREAENSATAGVGSERLISLDQRPTLWYDARAESGGFDHVKGAPLPLAENSSSTPEPGQSPLVPDNAHQPSIAFVPYLLTGDRYYAEEMAFWANYAMLRTYNGDGIRGAQGILQGNDVQAIAWALRNLAEAAAYYPDTSPVKTYLSERVLNNLEWLDTQAPSQNGDAKATTTMSTVARPGGPQDIALAEQNTVAYAIDRASKLGFAGGLAYRDAIAKFQLTLFIAGPGDRRAEAAATVDAVGGAGSTRPLASAFGPQARLSLMIGVESGWAGAQAAYDYLWAFLGVQPAHGRAPDLAERAGWALDFYSPNGSSSTPVSNNTRLASSEVDVAPANQGHHAAMASAPPGIGSTTAAATALPHNIPDFGTDPSRTTVRSIQSGNWSSASIWSSGIVPTANQVVHVDPGHVVTIDTTGAVAYTVAVHGTLRFNPSVNTRLKVTNLMVMGDHGMPSMTTVGYLEVGTAATPIAANVTAEILIANTALGGGVADPEQFGTGLLNFGKVTMHGSLMTPTWTRVAVEPLAGHTTFTLTEAVSGWRVGDRIVIPDTRHIKDSEVLSNNPWLNAQNQWEERTISAISADNRTITLTSALQFDHRGARDHNGVLDFLPHVGNLTRNAIVRSESATGTRGHTISVHTADTDVRYALFKDLGRTRFTPLNTTTNAIGRYPFHLHHNRGPIPTPANGYQFTLVGNAVDGGSVATQFKWGIAVHNSHYGLIKDNVVYNYNGASIATEDGSESFNVFDHNFALRGMGEPDNAVSEARLAMGTEGVGFWFRGPNNHIRNNVAANFQNPTPDAAFGYVFQLVYLGNIAVPNFKGADTSVAGQFTTQNGNNLPVRQFENNEAYGAMQGGLTYWWISSQDPQPSANAQESLFKDVKLWHIYNKTIFQYPSQKITYDGLKIRGQYSASSHCCGGGVHFPDYSAKNIIIRNSDIQGVRTGIDAPVAGFGPGPNLLVENSYLRNQQNINVGTNWSVNGCWMTNKLVEFRNTRIEAPPGQSLEILNMARAQPNGVECLNVLNEVRFYAHNGVATDNFQVYHSNAAVLPRPPGSCTPATRPGIDNGVTCPIAPAGPVPPTATMSVSPGSISGGQSATLTWSTTNATSVTINQGIGAVALSGTRTVSPTVTTTYTLTAINATGSVTATATVTVSAPDTTPPVISGVASSSLTMTGATITFTTNEPSSHQVEYGLTTTYGTLTTLDSTLETSHSAAVTGLNPGTLYHYRTRARDAAGNVGLSADFTFTTPLSNPPTARAIGVSFVGNAPASMGATESAGVVAKTNWNNATGATRTTPLALNDDTGAATGATVTWSANNLWNMPITDQAGNRRLMKGYLDTSLGGATTVTVAGLPAGTYDVYVYADGDNGGATRTGAYGISGAGITTTTINLTDAPNTNFNATFTQANNSTGNFVKFSIMASGFTLTATPGATSDAKPRAPVNGIQIVSTAPPAPDFTIAASPSARTVTQGTATSYTFTIGAINGFAGAVSLAVSGLPANATASFTPPSVTGSGTAVLNLTTAASTPVGTSTLTITGTSGSLSHTATVSLVVNAVPPAADFTISATPTSRTVTAGGSVSYTLAIGALNGFAGTVSLAVSSLPANATASFTPPSVTGSGSAALNVTTAASTPAGTTTLTITGTSGSLSHTATVSLVVNAIPPAADFTISATPGSRTVPAGGSASYTLAIGALNGFAGAVSLAASGLPANATASFTPPSVTGSGSSTMNVTTAASTPAGSSTLTITGSSGGLTHSATVQLVVSATGAGRAVGINFVGNAPASMGATESAGVVVKANWNNATGATRSTPLALKDDTGAATGTTVTWSSNNLWNMPITDQAGNRRLMKGYLDTGVGGATTVTVTGLPAGAYDVYVYADGDNESATRTGGYRISGAGITTTTINLTDVPNTNFNATFTQANNSTGNFVKFSITASGFTLTATPGTTSDGKPRAPVNAIQIVPQ